MYVLRRSFSLPAWESADPLAAAGIGQLLATAGGWAYVQAYMYRAHVCLLLMLIHVVLWQLTAAVALQRTPKQLAESSPTPLQLCM
jgi:hypothetical protein